MSIIDPEKKIARLQGEVARLRAALEAAEWYETWPGEDGSPAFCLWCSCNKNIGHARDCQRQVALGYSSATAGNGEEL